MKLYQNGIILTMDAEGSRAEAMVVEGDHIVRVGGADELGKAFPEAERVDLKGRTVMPGSVSYTHLDVYKRQLVHRK